jgi:hypothetical protein
MAEARPKRKVLVLVVPRQAVVLRRSYRTQ